MKQSNQKTPLVFRLAGILFCAVLLSVSMMGGLYARYVSSGSGGDSARVAKFSVTDSLAITKGGETVSSITEVLSLIPGESVVYTYSVTNDSEVAVLFTVTGERLYEELPLIFSETELTLAPGETGEAIFTVSWDNSKLATSFGNKMEMIEITVTASQID